MNLQSRVISNRQSERGVALIMALGIVAIIATWASTATYQDMVSVRRISNIQDEVRATMASESAFALVNKYLKLDAEESTTDSLEEEWAQEMPPFPIDEGVIAVKLIDSNRFYNLNDLVDDQGSPIAKNIEQLKKLFIQLELDPFIVEPLVDWMDNNDMPYGSSGAEDMAYFEKPYHVKNKRLDNWSELKLIPGFDYKTIQILKNHVTIRPANNNGQTRININTASAEVLMTLFPNMSKVDADDVLETRPYEKVSDYNGEPWVAQGDVSRLSVSSNAFMVRTHASFGRANVREEYLLSRVGKNTALIWRERLGWEL